MDDQALKQPSTMVTIDDMIADKAEALEELFHPDEIVWYQRNIDNNGLSVQDSIDFLYIESWIDRHHEIEEDIYYYFINYLAKYGMELNG